MSTLTQDELNNIRERTWAAFAESPEFVPQACADALKLLEHIEALEAELDALRDAWVWISLPLSQIQAVRRAH